MRPSNGAFTTPTIGTSSSTSPIDTPTASSPCRKFAVPSSGSTSQPSAPRSPPPSSPSTGMSGVVADEHVAHRGFAAQVGRAHPVAGRLLAHFARRAELFGDDRRRRRARHRARPRGDDRDRGRSSAPRRACAGWRATRVFPRRAADAAPTTRGVTSSWSSTSTTVAPASRQMSRPPR